jgi:hypothetical protein
MATTTMGVTMGVTMEDTMGDTMGGTMGGTMEGGEHEQDAGVRAALLWRDIDSLASDLHVVWCASGHNCLGTLVRDKVARRSGHIRIPS